MSRGIARCDRDAIPKTHVEPEHMEAMRAALKKVCVTLGLKM
jgi:hypothetical protein